MGFYLRKSIRVGPLRFNFSNSGIGVSAGIKGLRVGMGPRGNYVQMRRGSVSYRATLPPDRPSPAPRLLPASPAIPSGTHAPLEEIESAHFSQIVDSSSRELLHELNQKRARVRLWPLVATFSVLAFGLCALSGAPPWLVVLIGILGSAGTYLAFTHDLLKKTVVLFYDFDPPMEAGYAQLHSAASQIADCAATWHVAASGQVHDRKYHAGASSLVRRNKTFIRRAEPPYVKSNIETIAIGVGRQILHFFPDRVLVYDQNGVGAVNYRDLRLVVGATRFIEDGAVPHDAVVVDQTWQYVNKSGGPDRRFKDNRQLPICRYEEITLSSQSGLLEVLQISRCGFGEELARSISLLGQIMPKEASDAATAPPPFRA